MFKALGNLIKSAGLRGVDIVINPVGDGDTISVMLSFNQAGEFEQRLLQKYDDAGVSGNADKVMALRAALNTPLTIIGEPDEILAKVEQALANLREGLVGAATSYTALDISALLTKASTQAKAAKAAEKPKTKADKAKASATPAQTPAAEKAADDADEPEDDFDGEDADQAEPEVKTEVKATAAPKKAEKPVEQPKQAAFGGFDAFDSL